ncbi:MAG: signal peptidase I [Oscillospiraceae bacterium]|nr:signal peptidase I [Oscillospiraceae bacterium]
MAQQVCFSPEEDDPFAGYVDYSFLAQPATPAKAPQSCDSIDSYVHLLSNLDDETLDDLPPFFAPPQITLPASPIAAAEKPQRTTQPKAPQKHEQRQKKHMLSRVLQLFVILFCGVLMSATVIFSLSSKQDKSLFGLRLCNVTTGSMTPTVQADGLVPKDGFRKGDAILIKKIAPEDIIAGDIVTFHMQEGKQDTLNSHRVIKIIDQWNGKAGLFFITKGDANLAQDDYPVPGKAIVGKKLATIPLLGRLLGLSQQYPRGFLIGGGLLVTLLLVMLLASRPKRKKRGAQQPRQPHLLFN